MNNKFKLPKVDILFQSITLTKQMIFPLLIIFINTIRVLPWWGTVAIVLGLLVLVFIMAYCAWRNFSYVFEQDKIVIYSGVFSKKEKTIYYTRIHSVKISQNIVHRLLNLANLTIETPGVAKTASDGEVRCLSLDKAKYLQKLLQRMGEASRNEEDQRKEQLLLSIMLNLENSTSRTIIESPLETSIDNRELQQPYDRDGGNHRVLEPQQLYTPLKEEEKAIKAEKQEDITLQLNIGLMTKSALTSLNINIVLVWFAGLFTFADDIMNAFFPNSEVIDEFFNQLEFSKSTLLLIIVLFIGAIFMTWVLSIVFYIIKFFDYKLERAGKQINVSYGLFNRQSIVFDQTKVQSLLFDENPLRQLLGYGELKVNIVKSVVQGNQIDNSYVVIHPFIRKDKVQSYLQHLMPKCAIEKHEQSEALPLKSLYTYLLVPIIVSLLPSLALVYWIKWNALWILLISIIFVAGWRYIQFRSARISLDNKELRLITRSFSKYTVYIRRHKVISLSEAASPYQQKHKLRRLSLSVLGGIKARHYKIQGISGEQMSKVKQWFNEYIKQ